MTANLKAIYERGMLRLIDPLSLPDGTPVDVTITAHEEAATSGREDQSWDVLTQLIADCAMDTGVADLAQQHDHYLYGLPKKQNDGDRTR
jgi:predicted DNA-binding antitoxin AbrB/MazE fold protein